MDDSAPPQASTVQLTSYSLPLRLSARLLQSHRIHTPALCERFSKRRFAVFERFTSRKPPDKCRISKTKREGQFSDKKQPYPSQQNSTTSDAARCAKSNGCPSPGNPRHFPLDNNFHFVAEVPLSSTFEILHLSAGGCRSDESRKPKPYFKYLSWRAGMRRR